MKMRNFKTFLRPKSVAVVGVSENPKKLGSVVWQNIFDGKFAGKMVPVNPKHIGATISGRKFLRKVSDASESIDLVVVVVPAKFVPEIIDDCIKNRSKNVIVISAGFSEAGNREIENKIREKCEKNGINLLGPNCLGAIISEAKLNASFADGMPEAGKIAFVSQSGAFCTAALDFAARKKIGFSHFFSLGNKAGISEIEILESLKNDPSVEIFAFYLESIRDGRRFLKLIREIAPKKPIVILEPGSSKAAREAASSHTGSLAPVAKILKSVLRSAGAIQVFSMREMFGVIEIFDRAGRKNLGRRVAVLTNAGGVGVLAADLLEKNGLEFASFSDEILAKLRQNLPPAATIRNPVDVVGDADAMRYERAMKVLVAEKNVDQIFVFLTPQRTTEIQKTAEIIAEFSRKTDKNIVAGFIGGEKVASGIEILNRASVPVFRFPADAIRPVAAIANRVEDSAIFSPPKIDRDPVIVREVAKARLRKFEVLPQKSVEKIVKKYGFDTPKSRNFSMEDFEGAVNFAEKFFPKSVVMKISSPDFLHKTEFRGVFLNVDGRKKFEEAWKNLKKSIEISGFSGAEIQVQAQILGGIEVILGVKSDPNFGKILVFGAGGIFTEIIADATVRVLPSANFGKMIDQTRIGKILRGVRGERFAVKKLEKMMKKMQKLVLDFPEISAIDANPVIVGADRVVCVDLKIFVHSADDLPS